MHISPPHSLEMCTYILIIILYPSFYSGFPLKKQATFYNILVNLFIRCLVTNKKSAGRFIMISQWILFHDNLPCRKRECWVQKNYELDFRNAVVLWDETNLMNWFSFVKIEDCGWNYNICYLLQSERILSFVPPDGNFRVMSYHIGTQK